ncbi:MAG TPA: nuclear transport factor 2 family protein [Candidatus Angelobacter sp.]
MKIKTGCFCIVLIITMGLAQAQTSAGKPARRAPANEQEILQEIQQLETSLREAFVDGITVWWDQHLDEHYSGLNAEGRIANRTDAIHLYQSPELKYEEMVVSDVAARIFNADCVIATGKAAIKASYGGKDLSGDYYFVHVWIKNGTEFKLASAQATKIATP